MTAKATRSTSRTMVPSTCFSPSRPTMPPPPATARYLPPRRSRRRVGGRRCRPRAGPVDRSPAPGAVRRSPHHRHRSAPRGARIASSPDARGLRWSHADDPQHLEGRDRRHGRFVQHRVAHLGGNLHRALPAAGQDPHQHAGEPGTAQPSADRPPAQGDRRPRIEPGRPGPVERLVPARQPGHPQPAQLGEPVGPRRRADLSPLERPRRPRRPGPGGHVRSERSGAGQYHLQQLRQRHGAGQVRSGPVPPDRRAAWRTPCRSRPRPPRSSCASRRKPAVTASGSSTTASAWRRTRWPTPTSASPSRPKSTSSPPTESASRSSVAWPTGWA